MTTETSPEEKLANILAPILWAKIIRVINQGTGAENSKPEIELELNQASHLVKQKILVELSKYKDSNTFAAKLHTQLSTPNAN